MVRRIFHEFSINFDGFGDCIFFFICPHPLLFMVKSFNLFFIIKNVFDNYICTKCLKKKTKNKNQLFFY